MNQIRKNVSGGVVSAGCHINDVMNNINDWDNLDLVSAGCHINDVMN